MSNALFITSRWSDAAMMSASSTQGLLAPSNVQTYRPDQVWRATGCAAEFLFWDYGADFDEEIEALAFIAHNLSADAMVQWRLASTEANLTASPLFDSGVVSPWPASGKPTEIDWPSYFSLLLATPTVARWSRFDIIDPTNEDGFVQGGRLIAGPAFVPSVNVDINPSLGLQSPDEAGRTAFGHAYGNNLGPASRVLQLPMSALDEDEFGDELFELERYCGLAKDFAFCLNPAATTRFHRYSMQARFTALNPSTGQPAKNDSNNQVWQTTLAIEEVL